MNRWLDIALVGIAVLASIGYALYALGPQRIKDGYSRFATKYFGLRAARWFSGSAKAAHGCSNCPGNHTTEPRSRI